MSGVVVYRSLKRGSMAVMMPNPANYCHQTTLVTYQDSRYGWLWTSEPKQMDMRSETVAEGMYAFLQLFDCCLALGLDKRHPRRENLILDVFRCWRTTE